MRLMETSATTPYPGRVVEVKLADLLGVGTVQNLSYKCLAKPPARCGDQAHGSERDVRDVLHFIACQAIGAVAAPGLA